VRRKGGLLFREKEAKSFCLGCRVLLAAMLVWGTAHAQLSPAAKMSQVAANQLGILEYCQLHGQASAAAVRAEREAMDGAPAPALSTVRAEQLGRLGYSVAPDGQQIPVSQMAAQQGTTVPALCQDLARASLTFEAEIQQAAATRKR